MGGTPHQRRLAAILAADVVGYTRLVEQDTDGIVAAWKAARDDVIKPLVDGKSGRIVKFTGDGFLVEFPSVQDAVACAIALQEKLTSSPLKFRMGISVGDITDDGGDVHGEGVNIAARLEGLAEAGGICISGDVYNQVRNRIEAIFDDMGDKDVKHVSQSVRVYGVNLDSIGETQTPPVQHSEKTSIAVLPFDNMSDDPEQEYFSDGIVEDIITELSKFRWLTVIARNSTFTYKGKSVDIKTVGKELRVRYVVEGSVRKAGSRIRINAQLIDSTDGSHVWAERYDRQLTDIFDLQDEITRTLVATIEPELGAAERSRARKKRTDNLDAWELFQKALWFRYRVTPEDYDVAESLLEEAIALDPEFATAHAAMGAIGYVRVIMGFGDDPRKKLEQAGLCAKKAIALDDREAFAYCVLGGVQTMAGQYDDALRNYDYAIELNPNFAQAHISRALAMLLAPDCDGDDIRHAAELGIRLSPKEPTAWSALNTIGVVHLREGELEAAASSFQSACRQPITTYYPYLHLAATLKLLGRDKDADSAMASAMKMNPTLTRAKYIQQVGKPATSRVEAIGGMKALKDLGLPDE